MSGMATSTTARMMITVDIALLKKYGASVTGDSALRSSRSVESRHERDDERCERGLQSPQPVAISPRNGDDQSSMLLFSEYDR